MRPLTDEERETVAENFPLAPKLAGVVAKRFGFDMRRHGDDLIQAAAIGLMKAVQTHDPEKGTLATHAGWKARGAVPREWQASFPIRVPSYHWQDAKPRNPHAADAATAIAAIFLGDGGCDVAASDDREALEDREHLEHLAEQARLAMRLLPDFDREIIEARFFRGESLPEMGRRLGRNRRMAAIYVARAVKKLARLMEAESWD